MGTFSEIKQIFKNLFGIVGDYWVKRRNISYETIETCNGIAHSDDNTHTCALCVALNQTVFKNNNKPEFYHYHCKCKNEKYILNEITEDFSITKITNYLFFNKNKAAMMRSMGYNIDNARDIYNLLYKTVEKKFTAGDYKLRELNINGQHFAIYFKMQGNNEHKQEIFDCHIGCVAWPYGKIKVATPLIKD